MLQSVIPFCLLALMNLSGCGTKAITRADLSSDFRELVSHASEAELFIEQVQAGKITAPFARAHAQYLAEQSNKAGEELNEVRSSPEIEQEFADYRRSLKSLSEQMNRLPGIIDNPTELTAARSALQTIRNGADKSRGHL
jgi:hypothetical protein